MMLSQCKNCHKPIQQSPIGRERWYCKWSCGEHYRRHGALPRTLSLVPPLTPANQVWVNFPASTTRTDSGYRVKVAV